MNTQEKLNYDRIAAAIAYIKANFKTQPSLEEIAEKIHLSPFHFQRLFTEWAGTSPKNFLRYISVQYAKRLLKDEQATLFETALETGLSGPGRLHDLFVKIEGMTPAEYKSGGRSLVINYEFASTRFGNLIIASTSRGVCAMAFFEQEEEALEDLRLHYPQATFHRGSDHYQRNALGFFLDEKQPLEQIKLHLKGTDFQLRVWESLLKIPSGQLATYGDIAKSIENPSASRAVGSAIGSNPVAYLIPCHRVIQSTGHFGGYMWGSIRKTAIIGWEMAQSMKLPVDQEER